MGRVKYDMGRCSKGRAGIGWGRVVVGKNMVRVE